MIDIGNRSRVNVGCGKRNFGKNWIHVDGKSFPHVEDSSIFPLDLPDESMELVYASHVLEYFNTVMAVQVLSDWVRVLKPGGILRLAVPDFDAICYIYQNCKNDFSLQNLLGPLYGKMIMDGEEIYHKTCYDQESLTNVLEYVGLTDIKLWDWKLTCHAEFDDHSRAYLPHFDKENGILISLNMEGTKK